MLEGSRVRIDLLTGSMLAGQRAETERRIAAGESDIVIGTHALLTETTKFRGLALVAIDEQHRFGVHQRAVLPLKSDDPSLVAHTLVMTATPIPRTLSLTIFGDLDVSTIRGLPPGRRPVVTKCVSSAETPRVYDYVAKRIAAGEQAYFVAPLIDESESGLRDINTLLESLRAGALTGRRLASMHGRLPREEREAIMRRFRAGEIDALVATTVIEVGIDVPNACIMVIEHADRFGLAQLHQLRGRVGRGARQSLCVLIADPVSDDGRARIDAMLNAKNGFEIAEKDLEIRGPGEVFGTRQAGAAPFRVAGLPRDVRLLEMARRDAKDWIDRDPDLARPEHALLRRRLLKAHGDALGLGDVA
jgi:ATP-dependent DNA helicase RecG